MNPVWTYRIALVLAFASALHLASKKPDIESVFLDAEMEKIHAEVARRVALFTIREKGICHKELMEKVEAKVDSILQVDIKKLLADDPRFKDNTPPRPTAPAKPEPIMPKDHTPLAPLIHHTDILGMDSLPQHEVKPQK